MSSSLPSQAASLFHSVSIASPREGNLRLVWGHGWGQSGSAFQPLAEALASLAPSTLLDFPGFGASPLPPLSWGTAEYADATAAFLHEHFPGDRIVWLSHSFGGRVGLQMAARHPQLLSAMVLIAAAGLQRRRSPLEQMRLSIRRTLFTTAKKLLPEGALLDRLRQRMGSADYRNAGTLRPILSRVVTEDLTSVALLVKCPVLLLYGRDDTETPPEFGERLRSLIPGSELSVLDHYGHLNILNEGRHQLAVRIQRFLQPLLSR